MNISAELPDGFHLMAAESVPVKGGFSWLAYVRKGPLGQFRGGRGFSLQEAIDAASNNLRETLAGMERMGTVEPLRPTLAGLSGLKLNLGSLGLEKEKE